MRVDVVDLLRLEVRSSHRLFDRARHPPSIWMRRHRVVRLTRSTLREHFGVNTSVATQRVAELLEDQVRATLSHDETIPALIEGFHRFLRRSAPPRHRAALGKTE